MKYLKALLIPVLSATLFMSCGSDNDEGITPAGNCEQAGPPVFTAFESAIGASSVDFNVGVNTPSKFYYIISTEQMSNKTSTEIVTLASANATGTIIDTGIEVIACDSIAKSRISISNLPQETQLYGYVVVESFAKDTLQQDVKGVSFTTNVKLPIIKFNSTVKSRESVYQIYQPDAAIKYPNADAKYPLIIHLGGNGEISGDAGTLNIVRNGSLLEYLNKGSDIDFITIAPEHNTANWNTDYIDEVLELAKITYPVDANRVIVSGMSGGGIGTLQYAIAHPEQLAAIVPISGDANDNQACQLANMAVWAFHNDSDGLVATKGSIDIIAAINACSPGPTKEIKLTLFSDDGHNAWRRVYDKTHPEWNNDTSVTPVDIYEWMAKQSR